ncbi:MAG: DivIVA domain-containing protein [Acidobacteriota bacterium]|nr:DivIVA domain-containing protein [Acidobacteriota bacterium]
MDERRILSTTRQSSAEVARVTFATVRKGGLDPQEVRVHLEAVAREMAHLEQRVRELQEHLSEAQHRAAHPVLDEATLASALGTQSAAILRSAHEEAGRVTAEAQERATQLFSDTQQRSANHLIEAQERAAAIISEAEAAAATIDHDARLGAERLIESAKVNGEALVERAREQGRAILAQATDARKTVLNDLAVKRKALHLQIDQLRVARDHLGAYLNGLRDEVESVLGGLNASDEAARVAALEALRLRPVTPEPTEEELLAGTPLRTVPEVTLEEVVVEAPAAPAPSEATAPAAPERAGENPPPAPPPAPASGAGEDEDQSGTDVVNEIFARLRKATLEERGASAHAPRRAPAVKPDTPVGDLFKRRDASLEESLAVLTRRIKRVLQDDQNLTLERLRTVKLVSVADLEDEHAQRARYADAAFDALADAAAAGAQFAFDESGTAGPAAGRAPLVDCAADLAVTIVLALRRRILADGSGDAQERVNTAYKEWRGARVERLCTDAARRAFHIGVLAASSGRSVRFLVAPTDAPCDACALDAAAGERSAGLSFPSGAANPPLHAGCACTIVPV